MCIGSRINPKTDFENDNIDDRSVGNGDIKTRLTIGEESDNSTTWYDVNKIIQKQMKQIFHSAIENV